MLLSRDTVTWTVSACTLTDWKPRMQCAHCQTENRPGRRFCAECGAPLALPCAACGFANEAGEKFCGGCGTPLTTAPHTPAQQIPPPQTYTPAHLTSQLYLAQGDLEHAIRMCDQGLALSRASGNRNMLPIIVAGLGYAYALQGRLAEGRELLEEAISESISTGARRAVHWVWLSEGCRLGGHAEDAWQHARQALDLARQQKDRGDEVLALHQLGVVYAHAAPLDVVQAEAYYQQALALADELGMRPLVAHCHCGLGTLYTKTGQQEQARAELSTAIEMYRTMEMTFWLPQVEAVLAQAE